MSRAVRMYQNLLGRLGRNVQRIRWERGLTLQQLAEEAGMHWRHVQKIAHGEVNVTLETVARLMAALDVELTDLFAPGRGPAAARASPRARKPRARRARQGPQKA